MMISLAHMVMQSGARFSKQNTRHRLFFLHYAPEGAEFQRAASKSLLGLGVTYHALAPQLSSQGWDWLLPLLNVEDWKLVKVWAFVRLTGKWPATWVG